MRADPRLFAPAVALLVALAPLATAAPCHPDPYTFRVGDTYVIIELDGTVYVYLESNGVEELQRCDAHHTDDNCHCPPDTLVL